MVRNSVVLAVYLLFSISCFFTVHDDLFIGVDSPDQDFDDYLEYINDVLPQQ